MPVGCTFVSSTTPGERENFAVGFVRLNEDYNATGKTLKFSIKSDTKENGGNDQIRVYLEAQPRWEPVLFQITRPWEPKV